MKWTTAVWRVAGKGVIYPQRRKESFEPYTEPFRILTEAELLSATRLDPVEFSDIDFRSCLVSYQAQTGGFTICNIILDNKLYSGSSHCSKVDRWLPIRGQMLAFRRALESEGVELYHKEKTQAEPMIFTLSRPQFLKEFLKASNGLKEIPIRKVKEILSILQSLKEENEPTTQEKQ